MCNTKYCKVCNEYKDIESFGLRHKYLNTRRNICIKCYNLKRRESYKNNPEIREGYSKRQRDRRKGILQKSKISEKFCKNCDRSLEGLSNYILREYCSRRCNIDFNYKQYINSWKEGKETGMKSIFGISNHIRRYLFEKYLNQCCKCSWNETNPVTGKIPLQINHIDGNYLNNKEDNLELICPNCHSLTPNYGILNISRGGRGLTKKFKLKALEDLKKKVKELKLDINIESIITQHLL